MPPILQSYLGSALFWLTLVLITWLGRLLFNQFGGALIAIKRHNAMREWVYRRYTSIDGLIPFVKGNTIANKYSMQNVVSAVLFLLIGQILAPIGVPSAVAYFGAVVFCVIALSWLMTSQSWQSPTSREHWERVAELERELFGEIDEEVSKRIK
ncbi:MAG: hypothetical protein AAF823_00160 [Planctomycetota bacterium]